MCTDWDPSAWMIQVGKVDNDVIAPDTGEDATDGVNTNDGIDLGIVTSSSLKMNVKHVMSGVSGGTNSETTVEAAKGSRPDARDEGHRRRHHGGCRRGRRRHRRH